MTHFLEQQKLTKYYIEKLDDTLDEWKIVINKVKSSYH